MMDLLSYAGIGFYYIFFLVGSITIGYFILRVSYSEVRTYDQDKKLIVSGMLGLVIVFLSYLTNIFFFGVNRFLNLDSYIEIFTIIYALIFFLAFKYHFSFTPKFITIAMPVRAESKPREEQLKKESKKKEEIKEKPTLQQLKEEITGKEVEISIPLKTQTIQTGGVEELKEEVLGKETPQIEIPTKQTIDIPTKQAKPEKSIIQKPEIQPVQKTAAKEEKPEEGFKFKTLQTTTQAEKQPEVSKQPQKAQEHFTFRKETEKPIQKPEPKTEQPAAKPLEKQTQKTEGFKFQKKPEPQTKEETEIESILKDVVKETVEEAQGQNIPKHRRYLLSKEQKEKVKVIASSEVVNKEEFQSLVQDVYEELRKTKTEDNIQKIAPNVPPKEEKKPEAKKEEKPQPKEKHREREIKKEEKPAEALSLNEVLGQAAPYSQPVKEEKPTGLFAQLSGISENPPIQQKTEFVKIESESGMGCPNCHAKNTRIVFCPYCGGAMCTNCSPQIKIEGDKFIFTCPHCGEEVTVKKKK